MGSTQNSGCAIPVSPAARGIQAPIFEPSGEKWSAASMFCGALTTVGNGGRTYSTGGAPWGVDSHNVDPSVFSELRKNASVWPSGDNVARFTFSITISGSPPLTEVDHSP